MGFTRMGIARKMWVGVIALIVSNIFVVGFSGWRTASLKAKSEAASELIDARMQAAQQWVSLSEAASSRAMAAAVSSDPAVHQSLQAASDKAASEIAGLRQQLDSLQLSPADTQQLQKIEGLRQQVDAQIQKLKSDPASAAQAVGGSALAAADQYNDALREFSAMQRQAAIDLRHQIGVERSKTVVIAAVMGIVVLAGMAIGAGMLIRNIRKPLAEAVSAAARMAEGDLTVHIEHRGTDELGQLLDSLRKLGHSLHDLVGQVRQSTDSIHTASSEIAAGNQDLSNRTEQTAANLQQTASSMVDLTDNVRDSAQAAQQANQLVEQASQTAQRGGEVMSQVVDNMDGIAQASRKINDIIGVIDGIAFQTNILALNAAVEAARAGEQGRGFAVVAAEVRSLAQRSAQAAREIKGLIGASVDQVENGSKLVQDAGQTMQDIVASVMRVTGVIGQITAAASEQSTGIGQINLAVNQLDQMTQQNAALVEQSAAAASSLRGQADQLRNLVNVFRLDHHLAHSA